MLNTRGESESESMASTNADSLAESETSSESGKIQND